MSKIVQDEDKIPIYTNDTIDLGEITVNEVNRETLTQDQIYKYFKHQIIPSKNENLFKGTLMQIWKSTNIVVFTWK